MRNGPTIDPRCIEQASDAAQLEEASEKIRARHDYDTRCGIARKFTGLADAIIAQAEPKRAQTSAPIEFPVCQCGHKHFNRPGQVESGWHKACPICSCKKEKL